MSKIVWVGRSGTTLSRVRSEISSVSGSCIDISWSEYNDPELNCLSDDLFLLDFSDHSAHARAFAALTFRAPAVQHSLAVIPAGFDSDLLLAIGKLVDTVVQLPCSFDVVLGHVRRMLDSGPPREAEQVSRTLIREIGLRQIVGEHPTLLSVLDRIDIIAKVDLPAVILGETGTGKELCARAIHTLSLRQDKPFVPVECGAIPNELAESEMFGHSRGAYTDARSDTLGLIGMAEGGTLFLDEIDSLPLPIQAKLLRFLQERTYRPLGSDKYKQADVRVIAASNRSLNQAVKDKAFRDDLFFRLSVLRIDLPPLRERVSDIPILAAHFLEAGRNMSTSGDKRFSDKAVAKLRQYRWPGNIRELSNVVNRAVLFSRTSEITAEDIVFDDTSVSAAESAIVVHDFRTAKSDAVNAFERSYLYSLLQQHGGNITRAASAAGQDRSAFRRLLKKHNLSAAALS